MSFGQVLDSNPAKLAGRIADLAQGVALLVGLAGALGGIVVPWLITRGVTPGVSIALGVSAALVTTGVLGTAYYIRAFHDPDEYVIEELVGELTVRQTLRSTDRYLYRYEYSRCQRVRATRNNLRLVCIRSHWSGQSVSLTDVASAFPEHRLLDGGIPEEDGRIYRWIYLLGAVGRGRRVTVGIRHAFEDGFVPMKPYYRESGEDRRVESLIVRLRFRAEEAPARAWIVTWKRARSGMGRQEVAREECRAVREPGSDLVRFEIRVRRPRSDCAHGFVWRWPVPDTATPADTASRAAPPAVPVSRSGRRRRRS